MTIIRAAIVDDNDELRSAMNQYLQTQKDISIVGEAANGQDALKMIQEKQPDVVLLDMIMPALDGFGVLHHLQRTPLEKRPWVIAVTALGRDDFIRRAVELGVMYYMIKPVELNVLVDRISDTWKMKGSVIRPGGRDVVASVSTLTDALAERSVSWYFGIEVFPVVWKKFV